MENRNTGSDAGDVSSATAVLLGALAPGVNGPTWITLKSTFLLLGLCLAVMLALAFSSSDSWLIFHVAFLVLICLTLFLLLSWPLCVPFMRKIAKRRIKRKCMLYHYGICISKF
ncbi:uncharacterized protein LOC114374323 isoform X1 [Glycine soja]|uniref:uncharacterized protein LOC114374323 isoform X1 n=1 Tax=Glycine soja TaxID=3848 RepID=UPI00103D86FC|nr:uncharacterized protein LOC114374323 isoform X1 [Glycine soja]